MSKGIQPQTISPTIKGARYTFLIAGFFYGISKKKVFSEIEKTERPKRLAMLKEESRLAAINNRLNIIEELRSTFEQEGFEPEPGWEKEV